MSRAVRTARGAAGALIASLFAAASHALAGGIITPLAVIATTILALPLCVALAGRTGSLWRLSLGVAASQFVYHWTFAGLGMPSTLATGAESSGATASAPVSPHAAHLSALPFTPELISSGAADAWMWLSHAVAAALTIALMHRGERAALTLARVILRALPVTVPRPLNVPERTPPLLEFRTPLRLRAALLSPISHRGPPARSFSAH